MGDKDGIFSSVGKCFVINKPIAWGETCNLQPLQIDVKKATEVFVEDAVEKARWRANPFNHTITMEISIKPKDMHKLRKLLRVPKLPRKLKKHVKKACFTSDAPKRISPEVLRRAFALNYPRKASKVGYYIGVDIAKNEQG